MLKMKCGFVALLGKPNAGKSTLLNACIGQKIAGVSTKPQTTRNKILGIDTIADSQIIYLDTPGIHSSHQSVRINQIMNQAAWSVLEEADYVCYLIDAKVGVTDDDILFLREILKKSEVPVEVFLSKTDSIKKIVVEKKLKQTEEILKDLELYISSLDKKENHLVDTVPSLISAKRPANIKSLRDKLANSLPEGPFLFGEDELTDKSQKFVASEMIREQVFRQLGDEIPYGITVVVDSIEFRKNIHFLDATIVVEREAHKPIVIGAKGARIKKLGENSRDTLERHFETQVMLNLFVKVQSNWINNDKLINELQGIIESETL